MLWCFVALPTRLDANVFLIPIGVALGLFVRWQGYARGLAVLCTTLSCVLAFAYAEYLFAAVRIAQSLSLSLREALFKSGFALTADIAWGKLART